MPDGNNVDSASLAPSRRRFVLTILALISGTVASVLGVPLAAFFALPAFRRAERRWLKVGRVSDFAEGRIQKVLAKPLTSQVWPYETPAVALYVANHGRETFTLFHIHCTHVGCPVHWNDQAGRFFSPCHGGVFDVEGRVLAGPPPRPLDRYEYKIENGILYAGRIYKVNEDLRFREWHHI